MIKEHPWLTMVGVRTGTIAKFGPISLDFRDNLFIEVVDSLEKRHELRLTADDAERLRDVLNEWITSGRLTPDTFPASGTAHA